MTWDDDSAQPKASLGGGLVIEEGEQPVASVPRKNFERFINDPKGASTGNKKTAKGVRSMVGNVHEAHQNVIPKKMMEESFGELEEDKIEEKVRKLVEENMTLLGGKPSLPEGVEQPEIEPDTALDNLDNIHADTFNFLFICSTFGHSFNFALLIFLLQFSAIALNLYDLVYLGNTYSLNVPCRVNWQVSVSQVICLAITVLISMEDAVWSFINLVDRPKCFILLVEKEGRELDVSHWKWITSNLLRLIYFVLSLVVMFILILQSENVLNLYFNFAALTFINELDETAFLLAESGFLFKKAEVSAKKIKQIKVSREDSTNSTTLPRWCHLVHWHRFLLPISFVALFFGWLQFFLQQRSGALISQSIHAQVSHNC